MRRIYVQYARIGAVLRDLFRKQKIGEGETVYFRQKARRALMSTSRVHGLAVHIFVLDTWSTSAMPCGRPLFLTRGSQVLSLSRDSGKVTEP